MLSDEKRMQQKADDQFEVAFTNDPQSKKHPAKPSSNKPSSDLRLPPLINDMKQKIELYKQCSSLLTHLKDSRIVQDEVIVELPEHLLAKYIIKSITYLKDDWLTLNVSFIKQGDSPHKITVQLAQVQDEQIANMCAELNECIDHFIARAT